MQGFYHILTFLVVFIAGILGAVVAGDLQQVTDSSSLPQELIDKVASLRDALVALVVRSFTSPTCHSPHLIICCSLGVSTGKCYFYLGILYMLLCSMSRAQKRAQKRAKNRIMNCTADRTNCTILYIPSMIAIKFFSKHTT